jgi:predicted HTH domain antitoxin
MSIVIPDEIIQTTRLTAVELQRELAIALFQREKLTLGQASKLAAMNQWQFQQLLANRNIPLHYDVADFETDLQMLAEMRQP